MARTDFVYVNVSKPLAEVVDTAVDTVRRRGSQVYRDRRDFVERAIHSALEKEGMDKEVAA